MAHNIVLKEEVYQLITEKCLQFYREGRRDIFGMQQEVMDLPEIPMHYPYHHYIVPAVLLTAADVYKGKTEDVLRTELAAAEERAKNVLGGFCGFYGTCGAAVGVGIFFSVFTNSSPVSKDNWAACNRATADALHRISEIEGPRCCKRVSFQALYSAAESMKEKLQIEVEVDENVTCHYSHRNLDCKGTECPFFKEAGS